MEQLRGFFVYRATKKVKVRSLKLGMISWFAFSIVCLYIAGYQISYKSRHFGSASPMGTVRVQAQRPVKNHCNVLHPGCEADFTPRENLSYCEQARSRSGSENEGIKLTDRHIYPCEYWDEHQMAPSTFQHGTLLIPTRVTVQQQTPNAECDIQSKTVCANTFSFASKGNTSYIADVERFTLLIDHAFTMPREAVEQGAFSKVIPGPIRRGSTIDFPGYWEKCKDPESLTGCKLVKVPCIKGISCDGGVPADETGESEIPGIYGLSVGDVVSVGTLLSLAGIDLDKDGNTEGESLRHTGVAIQVDVNYVNREPFRLDFWNPGQLHYIYRVTHLPVETYKATTVQNEQNGHRLLSDIHGIFIYVAIQGDVRYFDPTQLQLLLATFMSLLAIANAVVNLYAQKLWRHKDVYRGGKYDSTISLDHDDPICGFQFQVDEDIANKKRYGGQADDFIKDFISLDGEALRWAGTVVHQVHEDLLDSMKKDEVSKKASSRALFDLTPRAREGASDVEMSSILRVVTAEE
eukprot:TRINITY_DN36651_c0_g2_i1.p1 TRINITY_DN36651_c0_g2~~TRINITY_DN36651_c0_g2_i1.p1  ORF type:complete len:521 (-),score=76.17 TRINITY_DN36651_c0_g2_i1:37-1599(-)